LERRDLHAVFGAVGKVTPTLLRKWPITVTCNRAGACEKHLKHGRTSFNLKNVRPNLQRLCGVVKRTEGGLLAGRDRTPHNGRSHIRSEQRYSPHLSKVAHRFPAGKTIADFPPLIQPLGRSRRSTASSLRSPGRGSLPGGCTLPVAAVFSDVWCEWGSGMGICWWTAMIRPRCTRCARSGPLLYLRPDR
jgi:hypothetical protein